jgi:hypothetical protein
MLLKNVVKIRVFFFKRVNCDCDVMVFDVSMAIVRDGPHGFFYVSMTLSGEGLNSGRGNDFCRVTVFDIAKNCVQMWSQGYVAAQVAVAGLYSKLCPRSP